MQLEQTLGFRRLERSDRLQNRVLIEVLSPSKFVNLFRHNNPEGTYCNYLSTKSTSPLLPLMQQTHLLHVLAGINYEKLFWSLFPFGAWHRGDYRILFQQALVHCP